MCARCNSKSTSDIAARLGAFRAPALPPKTVEPRVVASRAACGFVAKTTLPHLHARIRSHSCGSPRDAASILTARREVTSDPRILATGRKQTAMPNQDKCTAKVGQLLRDYGAQINVSNLSYESAEAGNYLHSHSESIRRYIKSGRLPAILDQCIIDPHVLADFFESRMAEAA